MAGRGTTATLALERAKVPFTLHEYAHDPRHDSYGLEASEALGVPPERVFKTLAQWTRLYDEALAVAIVKAGAEAPDAARLNFALQEGDPAEIV